MSAELRTRFLLLLHDVPRRLAWAHTRVQAAAALFVQRAVRQYLSPIVVLPLCLAGCAPEAIMPTAPATSSPKTLPIPTPTVSSTAGPTPIPVIAPANAHRLQEIASWGSVESSSFSHLRWSPDGRRLALVQQDGKAVVWEMATRREMYGLSRVTSPVVFSPDGQLLAAGMENNAVKLWVASDGRERKTFTGHSSAVRSLAFSPDGRWLFAGSTNGPQKLWQVATGQEVGNLDYLVSGVVTSADFSRDGGLLALGTGSSRGQGIEIWDAVSLQRLRILPKPMSDDIQTVVFSSDGQWLASGSLFGNVELWEVASGRKMSTLSVAGSSIPSIAFSPDGQLLAVATSDG